MLAEPPETLLDHKDKKELINYLLDKAFLQQTINIEYIESAKELFKIQENREMFLTLLEADYKSFGLNYLEP